MSDKSNPATFSGLSIALGLYIVWTAATWYLEGRIDTLLRPEAVGDRLIYALANLVFGIVVAVWVVRRLGGAMGMPASDAGFGSWQRTTAAILIGIALGLAFYVAQGAPSRNPVVLINAYAQVLVVSAAEVLVCWSVLGTAVATALGGHPFAVDARMKPRYHLGASMLAAFSAGLAHLAWERFHDAGAPPEIASLGASHLLHTVASNIARVPLPAAALTGPAVRGDVEGVRRQAATVRSLPREVQQLYRVHAEHSLAIAAASGRIEESVASRLRAVLREQFPSEPDAG